MPRQKYLVLSALLLGCGGISTTSRDGDAGSGAGGAAAGSSSGGSRAGSNSQSGFGGTTGAGKAGASTGTSGSQAMGGALVGTGGGVSTPPRPCAGVARPAPVSACSGIKTGTVCLPEGQQCDCLACGLADLGRRDCQCSAGVWVCTVCVHPGDIFPSDPPPLCTIQADKLSCRVEGQMCQGAPGGEVCMCYVDDEGILVWDCDKLPSNAPW
jgi:hypothetical protein